MSFTHPSAVLSGPGTIERIRGAGTESGRAERSSGRSPADHDPLTAAAMLPRLRDTGREASTRAIQRIHSGIQNRTPDDGSAGSDARPDHRDFCQLQKIVPRGETRLDGAHNKNISLHAQGPTPRNFSGCVSSTPRSWPAGHDPRSVYPATSPRHSRSQAVARPARSDARPSRNDLLAR